MIKFIFVIENWLRKSNFGDSWPNLLNSPQVISKRGSVGSIFPKPWILHLSIRQHIFYLIFTGYDISWCIDESINNFSSPCTKTSQSITTGNYLKYLDLYDSIQKLAYLFTKVKSHENCINQGAKIKSLTLPLKIGT